MKGMQENMVKTNKRINQKCPNTHQFAMETLINLFCC